MRRWLALVAVALVGCVAHGGSTSTPAVGLGSSDLAGRPFRAIQLTEAGFSRPLLPGTSLLLVFIDSTHLGARAGCNSFGATYRLDGSRLMVSNDVETLIACAHDLHSQEDWLFDFLRANPAIALSGDALSLGEGDRLALFLDVHSGPDRPSASATVPNGQAVAQFLNEESSSPRGAGLGVTAG
jgi:heat shock protein HslJ